MPSKVYAALAVLPRARLILNWSIVLLERKFLGSAVVILVVMKLAEPLQAAVRSWSIRLQLLAWSCTFINLTMLLVALARLF